MNRSARTLTVHPRKAGAREHGHGILGSSLQPSSRGCDRELPLDSSGEKLRAHHRYS